MKVKIKRVRGGSTGDQRDYGLTTGSIWNYEDKPINNNLAATISAVPRDEANIEAERGETVVGDLDADGNLEHAKIGGKRHFEGGTPLSVPDGSFIFSDTSALRIKNKELLKNIFGITGNRSVTPADVAKKYELNKYKDMLQDPNVDPMTKKTAQMMIDNNLKKLGQLALIQEGMKGFPDGIPDIAMPLFGSDMGQGMGGGEQGEMGMAKYGGLPKAQRGIGYGTKNAGKAASYNTNGAAYTAEQLQRAEAIRKAAEEKKKAEIAANQAASRKMYRDAQIAKKIQTQGLQDLSSFTNKEGRDQNYLDLMNRFAKFRDTYIKEMQDAIKYNRPFVMSDFLKSEAQGIKTAVEGKQGDILGSAKFPSWRHPVDAWSQFSIAGGTDQGQIDDMKDVVQNMANNPDDFMKQVFPAAYKENRQAKAIKQYDLYNKNATRFTSQLQKVIDTHKKYISEGKQSPYDETNIQKAYSLIDEIKNLPLNQAKQLYKDTHDGKSLPLSDEQLLKWWDITRKEDPDFGSKQTLQLNKLIKNSALQGIDSGGYMILDPKLFPTVSATGVVSTPKEESTGASDFDKATTTAEQANQASKDSSTTVVLDPNKTSDPVKEKRDKERANKRSNTGTTTNQGTTPVKDQNANVFVPTDQDKEYKYGGDLDQAQNGKQLSYDIRLKQLRDFGKSKGYKFIRPAYFDEANPLSDVGYQSPAKDKRYRRNASGEIVPVSGLKNSKTNVAYKGIDDFINYADPYVNFEDYASDEAALKFANTNTSDADRKKWALDKWKADLASKDPAVRKKAGSWFATRANDYGKAVLGPGAPEVIDTTQDKYWEIGTKNLNTPFPVLMDTPINPEKEQEDLTEKKTKTEMEGMPDVAYQYGYERAPWFRQDLANLYGSVAAAANIDRGAPPIMQSSYSPLVDATFLDPAQQIAALQGNLNTTQAAIRASQDGPNAVANLIAASASAAPNIANVIADYDNKNVGIANQRDQLNNQIMTRDLGLNRDYVKRFYDENVVRDQQYDNAVADAASEVRKAYMQGETNRDSATSANVQNPNYSFDPLTGRYFFKKGYDPRTGAPLDDQMSAGELFKYYTEQYNLSPDQAIDLITGTRAKSKSGYGNENTAQYGGYTYNPIDVIWNY